MGKYIDTEKLKKFIEELKKKWGGIVSEALEEVEEFIDSTIESEPLESILVHPSEILETKFKEGTCRVNGEEKPFKGGIAKIAILEIRRED